MNFIDCVDTFHEVKSKREKKKEVCGHGHGQHLELVVPIFH